MRRLASTLGYSGAIAACMAPRERGALDWLAASALLGAALVTAPLAYAVWLSTHRPFVTVLLGALLYALWWLLMRLCVASRGCVPGGVWLVASLLAAQPAQLVLMREHAAQVITHQRQVLLAAQLASGATSAEASRYRDQLARCEFVALRLQLCAADPALAVRWTLAFLCLVAGPSWLCAALGGSAIATYRAQRAREQAQLVAQASQATEREIAALLAHYATYERRPATEGGER